MNTSKSDTTNVAELFYLFAYHVSTHFYAI